MNPIDFFKFIVFLTVLIFIPGYAIISQSILKKGLLIIFLSVTVGIVIFALTSLIGGLIGFRYFSLLIAPLSFAVLAYKKRLGNLQKLVKLNNIFVNKTVILLIFVILCGTVFQNLIPFKSGRVYDFGIGYWGPLAHDGIWHESLSSELVKNFPPNNPTLSGSKLSNYHYFYNLLVADTHRYTGISVKDLIYRFYPILFSILLGIGSYLLSVKLFKNRFSAMFSLIFVYFGSSFGFLVEWFRQRTLGGESTFWANQPVSMNVNPPFAISLSLFISAIYLFFLLEKKDKFLYFAFFLISGALIGFKVYAGVILVFGIMLTAITSLIFRKNTFYFKLFFPVLILSLIIFFSQTKGSGSLIEFKPLWLVDSMIDFNDRVGWAKLSSARSTYFASHNWLKYIAAEKVSVLIFIVGNLGTRIIALVSLIYIMKKKFLMFNQLSLVFCLSLISLGLPLLFVQKGNPWNTVQFLYYFMFMISIFAGPGLYLALKKLPRSFAILVFIPFFIATSLSSFSTFRSGFQGAPARITTEESEGLEFLKSQAHGVVITPPFNINLRKNYNSPFPISVYETSAYMSANTSKEVFVEDEFQQEIFQNDYKNRLKDSQKLFTGSDTIWSREFLSKNKIRYIYVPKAYESKLNVDDLRIKKMFENSDVVIYAI